LDLLVRKHRSQASLDENQHKQLQVDLTEATESKGKLKEAHHMIVTLEKQLCEANKNKEDVASQL